MAARIVFLKKLLKMCFLYITIAFMFTINIVHFNNNDISLIYF